MKKERNGFFANSNFGIMDPNMQMPMAMNMPNTTELESKIAKLERAVSRLEARVSKLENNYYPKDTNYDVDNNMYIV